METDCEDWQKEIEQEKNEAKRLLNLFGEKYSLLVCEEIAKKLPCINDTPPVKRKPRDNYSQFYRFGVTTEIKKLIGRSKKRVCSECGGSIIIETEGSVSCITCINENCPTNKNKKAFNAAMAYEMNCRRKYDRFNKPSLPLIKGERMEDFAIKYGTTVKEMKACELEVERVLGIDSIFKKK